MKHSPIPSIPAASSSPCAAIPAPGEARAPAYSHCPDCGAGFSDRIVDEDTGCRYPVDDGEYYCEPCDHLFTADYLAEVSFDEPLIEVERIAPGRIAC